MLFDRFLMFFPISWNLGIETKHSLSDGSGIGNPWHSPGTLVADMSCLLGHSLLLPCGKESAETPGLLGSTMLFNKLRALCVLKCMAK